MMVELPDEMVQRWLAGDGLETDDEIILTAIHHAKKERGIAELYSVVPEAVDDRDRILADLLARHARHPLPPPVWGE